MVVTLAMATIAFVIIVGSAKSAWIITPFIPQFGWQGVMSAASVVSSRSSGLIQWQLSRGNEKSGEGFAVRNLRFLSD